MELGGVTEGDLITLLKRLQGSGYAAEEGALRHVELEGIAKIAAMACEALVAVARNLELRTASEALNAFERVRFFLGDSSLTLARRRARLLAFSQGAHKLVQPRLDHAFGSYVNDSDGATLTSEILVLEAHRASPLGGLFVARRELPWSGS